MTESSNIVAQTDDGGAGTVFAIGAYILRWRRRIMTLGLVGGTVGLAVGLLSVRQYTSTAIFIPQSTEGGAAGLALAASQFGIRVPTAVGGFSATIYLELMRSRTLLEPLALDSVDVIEDGRKRVPFFDLFQIKQGTTPERLDQAKRKLEQITGANIEKKLGGVKLTVTTPWPSVSLALMRRLIQGVNDFNLRWRKSQASAERQFVEAQATEAEKVLHAVEDRVQIFSQRNRAVASPELLFERERLNRELGMRQAVYVTLMQNREEARMREVRDTPVITMFEEPRLATLPDPRGSIRKALIGGVIGGILALIWTWLAEMAARGRSSGNTAAKEFFRQLDAIRARLPRTEPQ